MSDKVHKALKLVVELECCISQYSSRKTFNL